MLIYALSSYTSRPTHDLDFLAHNIAGDLDNLVSIFTEICNTPSPNSFLDMTIRKAEPIAIAKDYPGTRLKIVSTINRVTIPFSIDIGLGDPVVPNSQVVTLQPQLPDFVGPTVRAYSLYSSVAEKLDAIAIRMELTSRMKDFYDIWFLAHSYSFQANILRDAITATMNARHHSLPEQLWKRLGAMPTNNHIANLWKRFSATIDTDLSFDQAISTMVAFLRPITCTPIIPTSIWSPGTLQWS